MSVGHFLSLSFGSDHLRVQGRAVHGGHVRYFGMGEHSNCRQQTSGGWTGLLSIACEGYSGAFCTRRAAAFLCSSKVGLLDKLLAAPGRQLRQEGMNLLCAGEGSTQGRTASS